VSEGSEDQTCLSSHYLYREPSAILGIVSVLIALTLLGYAISEFRRAGQSRSALSVISEPGKTENVPVLHISAGEWQLNGSSVNGADVLFRLSGIAATAHGIIVEYDPRLPANILTQALDQVNKAGFTQVAMRTTDNVTTGTAINDL